MASCSILYVMNLKESILFQQQTMGVCSLQDYLWYIYILVPRCMWTGAVRHCMDHCLKDHTKRLTSEYTWPNLQLQSMLPIEIHSLRVSMQCDSRHESVRLHSKDGRPAGRPSLQEDETQSNRQSENQKSPQP